MAFTNDAGPVRYYAFDRATRTGRFLFDSRPEMARYELARMEPFSFTTRDGLTVHGYVTFPPDGGRSRLPAGPGEPAAKAGRVPGSAEETLIR